MSSAITSTERRPPTRESERPVALIGAGVVLGVDRVPAGRSRRRAAARPDEDAVTLAAEACALALEGFDGTVGAICFVTTTPPYEEGGSVQPLAEILGLQGDVYALELTASWRDGLAGVRLARSLSDELGATLLCAANADPEDSTTGDGAVALLLGPASGPAAGEQTALANLTPAASSAVELRDRWRLPGDSEPREADKSFVQAIGTERLSSDLIAMVPETLTAPPVVIGPDARGSASIERSLGGPGDPITSHVGILGAAHPLLRLVAGLDSEALVVAVANGLGEALHVAPTPAGDRLASAVRGQAADEGHAVECAMPQPQASDFDPFSSGPRSWRDRASDLRLEGLLPPSALPAGGAGREYPRGAVIAWTADKVYPAAPLTEMVAVEMDGSGRFFGQVAMGEHVSIGDRVELVPRRLHQGGGVIQYFWKARGCR
jgi:hydroxymethylglutaryl-CoA synthase